MQKSSDNKCDMNVVRKIMIIFKQQNKLLQ